MGKKDPSHRVYHARSSPDGIRYQPLAEHLRNVATLAREFANEALSSAEFAEMAWWAGLLHDLGKYSEEFQQHRLHASDWQVEHAAHGAALAVEAGCLEVAFAVAGHHSGLPSLSGAKELRLRDERCTVPVGKVLERAKQFARLASRDGVLPTELRLPVTSQLSDTSARLRAELRTRMLFSCLVDADRLDAEAWSYPERTRLRATARRLEPAACIERVEAYLESVRAHARVAPSVQQLRDLVQLRARSTAARPPGFFSLNVPTGGGKTLASLLFALLHAQHNNLRRVIYVLPYLTITEQVAGVLRKALSGSGHPLVEDHSGKLSKDPELEPALLGELPAMSGGPDQLVDDLLTENWSAPFIVTTTVQFFESIFSDWPSRCRKLHNIPRSVIVLDECQVIPREVVGPTYDALQRLVEDYGCSVILSTATAPAVNVPIRRGDRRSTIIPPGRITDIFSEEPNANMAERVQMTFKAAYSSPREAAIDASGSKAVLMIVNTRQEAREIFLYVRQKRRDCFHLSTRMCKAHRRNKFRNITASIRDGSPVFVVSTQLIEAGVDIDFPEVWRQIAPMDSIVQAAGRCNRQGLIESGGKFVVFSAEKQSWPDRTYREAAQITLRMLERESVSFPGRSEVTAFFQEYYSTWGVDDAGIQALQVNFDFPAVARKYRIIDDERVPVVVDYGSACKLLERLAGSLTHRVASLGGALGQYTVDLGPGELRCAEEHGLLEIEGGIRIYKGPYDDDLGLVLPGETPGE